VYGGVACFELYCLKEYFLQVNIWPASFYQKFNLLINFVPKLLLEKTNRIVNKYSE